MPAGANPLVGAMLIHEGCGELVSPPMTSVLKFTGGCAPLVGVTEIDCVAGALPPTVALNVTVRGATTSCGVAFRMVKFSVPLVSPEIVTLTVATPSAAPGAMDSVAVIWLELTTVTLLTVTPGLLTFTVAPDEKFLPVKVTVTEVPAAPLAGLIVASVGNGALILNATGEVVPPAVVTLTFT